jgi:uncharacterized protein (DUF1697 family)
VPTLIALLRGINVGGNILKMERLREVCSGLGAINVRTYVQSGNVVFEAAGSAKDWEARLEKKLASECRLPPSVIVRTAAEMQKVLAGNPYPKEKGMDIKRLAVAFLQHPPEKSAVAALAALDIADERYHQAGREFYIHCPAGFADSKLYLMEKVLKQRTTTRNWNTITKLCEMCSK